MIILSYILISFITGFLFCWILKCSNVIREPQKVVIKIDVDSASAIKELDTLTLRVEKLKNELNQVKKVSP